MPEPARKKQFIINNYESCKDAFRWTYSPISVVMLNPFELCIQFNEEEVTKEEYLNTVEHMMKLFPQLPSIMEYTNCQTTDKGNKLSVRMSKDSYVLLKMASYSQYVIPGNLCDTAPPTLTTMPQFPHLIKMFASKNALTSAFAVDCFVRVLRAWMAFDTDDIYYVKDIDYGKATYEDRGQIFSKLPHLLDIIFAVFDENVPSFLSFMRMNAVGASVIYNFLFLTEIDMFHMRFLEEIRTYLKPSERDEDENVKGYVTGKHMSFLIMVEGLASVTYDTNGYAKLDSCENKNCCSNLMALKVQFLSFICDSVIDPKFALMLLCLVTSSKMSPARNSAMLKFATAIRSRLYPDSAPAGSSFKDEKLYDEATLSIKPRRTKSSLSSISPNDPISYIESIKTLEKKEKTVRDKLVPLYPLHLFVSSLEGRLYPSNMKFEALPLVSMYEKPTKVFPFDKKVESKTISTLDDVFFIVKS